MLIEYKNTDRKFDVENIRKSKMKNEIKQLIILIIILYLVVEILMYFQCT